MGKNDFYWLPQNRYEKLKGQTRLQIANILKPFDVYGQGVYINPAVEACMLVIEETWDVIRGEDKPIDIDLIRRRKRK